MKVKCKTNCHLLDGIGHTKNTIIINLKEKNLYVDFKQLSNGILRIYTGKGNIDFIFTGEVVELKEQSYSKGQLVLNKQYE